jgi:hypothetical protein
MPCPFDKTRPCGTTVKAWNRYTKAHLHKLAKVCGIKNVEKKTMDKLCKELQYKTTQKQKLQQTQKQKLQQTQKQKLQQTQKQKQIQQKSSVDFHNRPCGPKKSAKNPTAYTRSELEKLAKEYGISGIKKKTMVQLCAELKVLIKPKTSPALKMGNMKVKLPKATIVPPIPKTMKAICPKSHKNAFKPNYKCDEKTGTWKKIPKTGMYYYKSQFYKMSDSKLFDIAEKLKIPSIQKEKNRNKVIQKILQAQYPLAKMPFNKKNKYIQKFKKYLLSKVKNPTLAPPPLSFNKTETFPRLNVPKNVVKKNQEILTNAFPFKESFVKPVLSGYYDLIKYKNVIGVDFDGLNENKQWIDQQFQYQKNLPFLKQLTLLVYTYGGDTMIHAYLDKTFQIANSWTCNYNNIYIHPLFPPLLKLMIDEPDNFIQLCYKHRPDKITKKQLVTNLERIGAVYYVNVDLGLIKKTTTLILKSVKNSARIKNLKELRAGHPILLCYAEIMKIFFNNPSHGYFKDQFYDILLDELIKNTKDIIFKSPRLSHNLYVFKGLKSADFMDFKDRNMYHNKRFISTSITPDVSKRFSGSHCCMQKIHLLKGTSVMAVCLSYFEEYEILLPPDRLLYSLSKPYPPLNNKNYPIKSSNLIVTN